MPKAGPLFSFLLLGVAVGWCPASTRGEELKPDSVAPAHEQADDSIGRRTTFLPEHRRLRAGLGDGVSPARDAQKELQRVGCYDGEINGVWSPASQAAASRFLDRINARLPVEKPDDVLLALLRSSRDGICDSCPRGQEADAAGRCTPTALLRRPVAPVVTGALARASDATAARASHESSSEPQPQRGEPQSSAAGGQRRQPASSGYWSDFIRKVDRALGLN
jgi:hypothetical protein